MTDKSLTDLQPGQSYYVQVRAKHKTDPNLTSDWSKSFKFTTTNDLVAPKPVTNLTFVSEGTSFIAKWDRPTLNADNTQLTDLRGFRVRFIDANNTSVATDFVFTEDNSYTLTFDKNKSLFGTAKGNLTIDVRPIDYIGNIGTSATATAQNPVPANVTGLTSADMIESINVVWNKNPETDIDRYELYVSTASSSFIPSAANRRYAGPATTFLITTGNPVPHYIKVLAFDIFGQPSAVAALTTNTPRTTTSTDGTPPGPVTNLTTSSTTDGITAQVDVSWTAPADLDIDHYEIRYSTGTSSWSYMAAPSNATGATIRNLKSNTPYYIGVRVIDFSANASAWVNAGSYPYTTAADTTAPEKPAAPTVATSVQKALVSHTMKDASANNLASDTDYLEVYASNTGASFTPTPANYVTKIKTAGPGVSISELIAYPSSLPLHWKVIAVDTSGNKSIASDATLGTPGLIQNSFIEDATIQDAKIGNLSATKLTAGSAFVNDLFIRSNLTIDNANGSIKSDDYNAANRLGWKLDREGLYIYEGTVSAKSLLIQDSDNIVSAPIASFEFADRYYFNPTTNVPNNQSMVASNGNVRAYKVLANARYGTQCLRLTDSGDPSGSFVFFGPSAAPNLEVTGGETYIYSVWVKNPTASSANFSIGAIADVGATVVANFTVPGNNTWTRVQTLLPLDINATKIILVVGSAQSNAYDFHIDGIQVERQIGQLTTASPWTPPGVTSIAGESITTGSIRSSAPALGIPDQPAWSLNTTGGLQVGDALVRGNLTVGAGADLSNSIVKSSSYAAGTTGWIIKGDGSVEFNSGIFRGDLAIERVTSGLTTNLKATTGQQRIYTVEAGSDISSVPSSTLSTPAITGQHYAYDRSLSNGWYLPTVPNQSRKMRYFFGPTTERSLVMQTNTFQGGDINDNDFIVTGIPSTYPWNTTITSFKLGEIISYRNPANPRESTGALIESSIIERVGSGAGKNSYTYTKTGAPTTPYTPESLNQMLTASSGIIAPRSTSAPEYTEISNGTVDPLINPVSQQFLASTSRNTYYNKNLLKAPYDETFHPTLTPFGSTAEVGNSLVGAGTGQVVVSSTANINVTAALRSGMYDDNYKTPSYVVNFSLGTSAQSSILWFTNKRSTSALPANTNYQVNSLRRGRTYIVSFFIKTNLPGSQTSGTSGPPATDFQIFVGLEVQNGNSSQSSYIAAATNAATVTSQPYTVKAGVGTQRVNVAITIPNTPTTETDSANLYIAFPAYTPRNRQVSITHPQIEEKVWTNHADPAVAASNLPTAWTMNSYILTRSSNDASVTVHAHSNPDLRYDAYGRNARGNQLYNELNAYQVSDYKQYRNSPAYIDLDLTRDSILNNGAATYVGETASTKYRFSEAGLQFPTSFEPYMPASLQQFFSNATIAAGANTGDKFLTLSDQTRSTELIQLGTDLRVYTPGSQSFYIVDRAGWYLMTAACVVEQSGSDAMWFEWRVTNKDGSFTLNKTAVGRINVWEQTSTIMRFLQRDDILSCFLWSATTNAASHNVTNQMISIARIN